MIDTRCGAAFSSKTAMATNFHTVHRTITTAVCLAAGGMLSVYGSSQTPEDLPGLFAKPPADCRTIPLWHLNGKIEAGEAVRQLREARDVSGFGGVALLPMSSTRPRYLSEDYFRIYGRLLDESKRLGTRVVFYDDIDFPSGTAGGKMLERFPDDVECRLDMVEQDLRGPAAWSAGLPEGVFIGAVAMNRRTFERIDISSAADGGRISWQVPAGDWKTMLFTCARTGRHVDYLEPRSIRRFFSLTYDPFAARFAKHLGSTVRMTFFDDVGLRMAQRRTWTPSFNARFAEHHGFDPMTLYPALWHDIGPDTDAARVALFGFRAHLLSEGYPRMVREWAAKHGMLSSGHAMGQYHPQPAFLGGDHMMFYRHSDVPMIDSIHYYGHGRSGFKLTSSVATAFDRPMTAVEIYGNYKSFDASMLERSAMELFARGANLLLPHGMWLDPRNVRIKPLISNSNPEVAPVLAGFNDWAARCSLLLRGGRHVADIAVLYPVATMQAHARLDAVVDQPGRKENVHPGLYQPEGSDLSLVSDLLTGSIRRDFSFLHPETLDGRCEVKGSVLHLRNKTDFQNYRLLILPAVRVIHPSNMRAIRKFVESGGRVVATSRLPARSATLGGDTEVASDSAMVFGQPPEAGRSFSKKSHPSGGAAYFVPDPLALHEALADALPDADVTFPETSGPPGPEEGMLSYLHKVKDGKDIYYFANSTGRPVDMPVTLRGRHGLECWNPRDGTRVPVQVEDAEPSRTSFRLRLAPVESLFFVSTRPASGPKDPPKSDPR